ncbi:MAG: single-stranded DNA-binding protein [Akkermansia sp.]|nr:single-stranded DNA-binding protein [Akkermansia sp.]
MANLNKVMLIGNLTADPEVRQTPRGNSLTELRLAVNRVSSGPNEGERREETTFLDVTCWGRTGEVAAQYLSKGRPVFIEGRLQMDTWEDKQTGQRRSRIRIIAENLQLLGGREGGQQGGGNYGNGGGYGNNGGGYQQRSNNYGNGGGYSNGGGNYGNGGGNYGNGGGYGNNGGGYQQPRSNGGYQQAPAQAPAPMPEEADDDIPF